MQPSSFATQGCLSGRILARRTTAIARDGIYDLSTQLSEVDWALLQALHDFLIGVRRSEQLKDIRRAACRQGAGHVCSPSRMRPALSTSSRPAAILLCQ